MRLALLLMRGLLLLGGAAAAASPSAVEFARIEEWQLQQVADTVGHDDARRQLIRQRLDGWQLLLDSPQNRVLDDAGKLKLVNDFVNQTPFQCDAAQWCVEDYWATPIELIANHGGDCEDFAIAKFYALRALGIADEQLRMIYARIEHRGVKGSHVVLAYYAAPGAEPLILDNMDKKISPATTRSDLTPVFSFNLKDVRTERLWPAALGKEALNPWRDTWQAVGQAMGSGQTIRFLTPAQRDTPQCKALRARSTWCT